MSGSAAIKALGLTEAQYFELKSLLPARRDEAIARYHELTKFGVVEAKAVIAAMEAGVIPGGGPGVSLRGALELLRSGLTPAPATRATATVAPAASSVAALARLLPSGSRPPTEAEAAVISNLAAKGDFAGAAMQIGAGWGLDSDQALAVARKLRAPRRAVAGALMFVVAMALVLGLVGLVAWMAFSLQ